MIFLGMNLFGLWKIQNVEQVHMVSVPTLPASETINFFFKNTIYWKKLKICMWSWIRSWPNKQQMSNVEISTKRNCEFKTACTCSAFCSKSWFWKRNWRFQKLGVSEPTPDGLALHFECFKSPKGSFQENPCCFFMIV